MAYIKDHLLSLMRKSAYRPMTLRELIRRFNVPSDQKAQFKSLVKELCESGELVRVKGKRYGLAREDESRHRNPPDKPRKFRLRHTREERRGERGGHLRESPAT